jgi:DNA-binding transcriptional ArsR family regulator
MQFGIAPPHPIPDGDAQAYKIGGMSIEPQPRNKHEFLAMRRSRILQELKDTGEATTSEMALFIGGTQRQALGDLQSLLKAGLVTCRHVQMSRAVTASYWSAK